MDEHLTFANGTVVQGHGLQSNGNLFLTLYQVTLEEAFMLLINPENTQHISSDRYGQLDEFDGYTHLMSVSDDGMNFIGARMIR